MSQRDKCALCGGDYLTCLLDGHQRRIPRDSDPAAMLGCGLICTASFGLGFLAAAVIWFAW